MSDRQACRVLVIDGAQEVAELVRDVLEEEGYAVSVATHARANLCGGIREEVDLVIVDPGSGGHDPETWVEQSIACNFEAVATPLVVCTGHPRVIHDLYDDLVRRNINVLPKPFDLETLLHVVKGHCDPASALLVSESDAGAGP